MSIASFNKPFSNNKFSTEFANFTIGYLRNKINYQNIETFEHNVSKEEFHTILSTLKPIFSNLPETKIFIANILKEIGFSLETNYLDLPRLRAITSYAHKIKAAKPAFAIHRDTWYANSESQINWWIPLFDVTEENTFAFYPDYFLKPVKNDSEKFHYDTWISDGGFQSPQINSNKVFPETKKNILSKKEIKIPMNSGELLLFSASHLHGTRPNKTNKTRFSIDFRSVDLQDKIGAVNVDNQSSGSLLSDMKIINLEI